MVLCEMDRTGSTSQLAPNTSHRQFFQWAVKWFYANVAEDTSKRPDIPSIICMLQAIGFKLEEFEKNDQTIPAKETVKNGGIRVTMECGTSKMIATLEMDDVQCECPDAAEETNGSFWSISGTGPSTSMDNINRVEKTGSNLLPEMTKETTVVVRDVAYRLFKLINNKCDINQNVEIDTNPLSVGPNTTITKSKDVKKEGPVRSYTDYFDKNYKPLTSANVTSNLSKSKLNASKSSKDSITSAGTKLKRQGTYDLEDNESMGEPRASPPKTSSSPVQLHELCTSLGQISLPSDDEILSLGDYVVKAHQILDKAVNVIIKKLPPGSCNSSLQDDHFVKPVAPPLMSSSFCVSSPRKKIGPSSASAGNSINRSISSASSRTSSTSSVHSARPPPVPANSRVVTKLQRPAAAATQRGSGASTLATSHLPPMRERSSSFNVTRRTQQVSPSKNLAAANALRRKSSTAAIASSAAANVSAQRTTTLQSSKLPASKLNQSRNSSGGLTADRLAMSAATKRRLSPDMKGQSNSPLSHLPRGNVSLLKAPTRLSTSMSGNNTPKYGYSVAKK